MWYLKNAIALAALAALLLTGCTAETARIKGTGGQESVVVQNNGAQEISLSKISGERNDAVVFSENEKLDIIERAIQTAEALPGLLNVTAPRYELTVKRQLQKQNFHLWIEPGSEHGMIMDVMDTHQGYALTQAATAELLQIIEADERLRISEPKEREIVTHGTPLTEMVYK
ncbi:hypothetical protein [Paenibacillus sp. LHD-38]|uniref:hypothetical protein n=1 Tax=Paenibacillus sp. LHD-38 TaxID=3072143 RepID=UPI00280D4899|nr:hypothetical protein [Paenibacillus sp. LHD-38]MDQ8734395.1 hypothetical protein [Paenibacillus sp. LHD-38]